MSADTLSEVISSTQGLIDLARLIKSNMTPQYHEAATSLYKMINRVLQSNQTLLKWLFQFEQLDLREETKKEFLRFYDDYFLFRASREYYQLGMISSQVESVLNWLLDSPIKRLLAQDKEKLQKAIRLFHEASGVDALVLTVYTNIFEEFGYTLEQIKNNYSDAKSLQESLQKKTDEFKDLILKQSDDLNKLLNDYQNLSGGLLPNEDS